MTLSLVLQDSSVELCTGGCKFLAVAPTASDGGHARIGLSRTVHTAGGGEVVAARAISLRDAEDLPLDLCCALHHTRLATTSCPALRTRAITHTNTLGARCGHGAPVTNAVISPRVATLRYQERKY